MTRPMDTGSIEYRADRALPYTPRLPRAYGRRRLRPCATREEAAAALADELERLADEPPEAETVADWGQRHFDQREAAGHWRSIKRERDRWRLYVEGSRLGRLPIRTVGERDVRRWLDGLRKADGSRPAGQTLANALSCLRGALEGAREAGILDANPAAEVRIPKGARRGGADRWTWYTVREIGAILRAARRVGGVELRALYSVLIWAGLRPSEAWALRWDDVDHDLGVLHVRRAVGERREYDTPKGGRARAVPMLPPVRAALRALALLEGRRDSPEGLVWPSTDGGPHAQGYAARWPEVRTAAGLDDREGAILYACRHTCASHLLQGTWAPQWLDGSLRLEEVRDWLGHTSITVTQRYAHLATDAIRGRVRRPSGGRPPVPQPSPADSGPAANPAESLALPAGFEPATYGLGNRGRGPGSSQEVDRFICSGDSLGDSLARAVRDAVATGDGTAVIALLAEHGALVSRLHALAYAGDWPALVTECERVLGDAELSGEEQEAGHG